MPENFNQFNARLKATGRWTEFHERKAVVQRQHPELTAIEVWNKVKDEEYPPPQEPGLGIEETPILNRPLPADRPAPRPAAADEAEPQRLDRAATAVADPDDQENQGNAPVPRTTWPDIARSVAAKPGARRNPAGAPETPAAVLEQNPVGLEGPPLGKSDPLKDIAWCAEHMGFKAEASEAPSRQAWAMFKYYSQSPDTQAEFWSKIYPRIAPTKSEVEKHGRLIDDGRPILDTIEQIMALENPEDPYAVGDGSKVAR